jgi:hypothetical protein
VDAPRAEEKFGFQTCDAGSRRSASLPQSGVSLLNYFAVLNSNETREKILDSGPKSRCH